MPATEEYGAIEQRTFSESLGLTRLLFLDRNIIDRILKIAQQELRSEGRPRESMDAVQSHAESRPDIALRQTTVARNRVLRCWNIGWQIKNRAGHPLRIDAVRSPHGQYKAEEQKFAPPLNLGSGQQTSFAIPVHCDEPEGLVTENAFLIFHVLWLGEAWRIFARIRVAVNSKGEPHGRVKLVTTQQVGFSGVTG